MKIKKIRIKNFKSIIDSGDCYLEDDLTILAGKNESGKSSILKALHCFNYDENIDSDFVNSRTGDPPEITIELSVNTVDLNRYLDEVDSNVRFDTSLKNETYIVITKFYGDFYDYYKVVDSEWEEMLMLKAVDYSQDRKLILDKSTNLLAEINSINAGLIPHGINLGQIKIDSFEEIENFKTLIDSIVKFNYGAAVLGPNNRLNVIVNELNEILENSKSIGIDINENWDIFSKFFPNFILFDSFDDIMPDQVLIKDLESNEFIKDLIATTGLNTSIIKNNNDKQKLGHKEKLKLKINEEYSKYWTQDNTQITLDFDKEKVVFFIVEEGEFYSSPKERSKGKQWHLSFYIRITARTTNEKSNVLLIDEPGLFLHATAQRDIYNKLIDTSKTNQVLFSTHSPYLLDDKELHRVRLVEKQNTKIGTIVIGKIHAKAEYETLTPIMTAIGLELNSGIQDINKKYNIVVEGPADTYYLNAFSILLNKQDFNYIYGNSSGKMGVIGTILQGWGAEVVYLFDNDSGKRDGKKNLKKEWLVEEAKILSVVNTEGTVEDIFSINDFKKYILENLDLNYEVSNSLYIKSLQKFDKVLKAKLFLSKVKSGEVKLDDVSIASIVKLLKQFDEKFGIEDSTLSRVN